MSSSVAPRYGRIKFQDLYELTDRLLDLENFFGPETIFSIYGNDENGKSRYGLETDDLIQMVFEGGAALSSFKATCSDAMGRSVNLSLTSSGEQIAGQFVITALTPAEQHDMLARLHGTWTPATAEELEKRQEISSLMAILRHHIKARERIERQVANLPLRAQELADPEAVYASKKDLSIDKYPLLYDSFMFDPLLAPEVFIHLLEQLRIHFFQGESFYFRVVNNKGEPRGDITLGEVQDTLQHHRATLKRIYVEVHVPGHEWMTFQLEFGNLATDHRAELEVSTARNKQIQATIRDTLDHAATEPTTRASMIHEMFGFSPKSFHLDLVVKLLRNLSARFLNQEVVTAFLSTHRGETYSGLSLKALRQIYLQHEGEVSFLLFGVNQAETAQTFSLMFQFGGHGQQPHGSLSMMWGHHGTHQVIRALVWRELKLEPYSPLAEPGTRLSGREMRVRPAFRNRTFDPQPLKALVVMQLEAYWSDTIWQELENQLTLAGYSSSKAEGLFTAGTREQVWTQLNEVELMIVDLTYKHPGVFYYLGVAHCLGVRTVITSQLDRDIPEDFQDFARIVYDNNLQGMDHLRAELSRLIRKK